MDEIPYRELIGDEQSEKSMYGRIMEAFDKRAAIIKAFIPGINLTLDQVKAELYKLQGNDINFDRVLSVLMGRWIMRDYKRFLNDHHVTSLLQLLEEGRKVDSILAIMDAGISQRFEKVGEGTYEEIGGARNALRVIETEEDVLDDFDDGKSPSAGRHKESI